MKLKHTVIFLSIVFLALFTVNGLEIKDIDYRDSSQYLIITVSNPDNNIIANISIIGYMDNKIDAKVEMFNYTIPKYSIMFIRKKIIFNEKGEHKIFVTIKTKNITYTFYKKINVTYAYNKKVPIPEEKINKKIEIESVDFEISPYPFPPFYDFVYVTIKNNDYIPHYVNLSFSASFQGKYYVVRNNRIIKSTPSNPVINAWRPDIYVPPKSKITIPVKVNFYYSGKYTITVKALNDDYYSTKKTVENTSLVLKEISGDEIKVYNVDISCPLYVYNITCEEGYGDYAYSNWFDIDVYNTVDYDVYGKLQVFLCKKDGDEYIILSNKTLDKYFLAKEFCDGYSVPVKLNTSVLNPYDDKFIIFVLCKTGNMESFYYKTFKKPVKINNLEVKNYLEYYCFVDESIFYDVCVNVTNNLNEKIYVNISIKDIYNKTYSKEIKLNKSYNIIKFDGLKINAKDLSHDGKIKLNYTITVITPPYEKYYTIKKNITVELSLTPIPPVYVCNDLNDNIFVGYPQNLSFSLKKIVGRSVDARVYITVPDSIKNYSYFEEKYLKIGTMEEVPVNIKTLFLKEYEGPIYIHVDTNMGVRECVVARIIKVMPIISCEDVYLHNYTVFIKIRNRTQGFVKNEPIVGYPTNITVELKSYLPNVKGIEIWISAMDEDGKLTNCSERKIINIYGNYKKVNFQILLNKSFDGYLVVYAKTGGAVIPLYYKPIMVTYPVMFNLEYNHSYPWANLTLSHNYQVPIKVNATVDKYFKTITIYPYKEMKAPFYVGVNRSNITVSIEVLNNISTIKKFNKTFYFKKSNEIKTSINKTVVINITNITNETGICNQTEMRRVANKTRKETNETKNNITLPPNIKTETSGSYRKNLIILLVIGVIITIIGLLMYEPTRPKVISIIASILYKLKIKEKPKKKETIKLPKPPKIYISDIIYSLGDTVRIEIFSDVDIGNNLYILSPTNKKYKIELIKTGKNKYLGLFKIPENEVPGQYFIIYEPENLSIGGFLVIGAKKNI